MSVLHQWNIQNIINLELAKQCIQNLPSNPLKVDCIEFFGQGWDNVAFLVNDEYVFRFPRKQEADQLLCNENLVLPKLHSMVPLSIPKLVYFGKPTSTYPFHFHGYKKLEGMPAYQVDLSNDELKLCLKSLARFLKKLHNIKSVQAKAMGAQNQMYDRTKVQLIVESLQKRKRIIEQKNIFEFDGAFINQVIAKAQSVVIDHDDDCLVHGDLDYRHMLLENNKLTGIIDWGDIGINHPVTDFEGVYGMFPKSMHKIFFEEYGLISKQIWSYAKFLALHRSIILMMYGYDIKDIKMFHAAKKSYERLKD